MQTCSDEGNCDSLTRAQSVLANRVQTSTKSPTLWPTSTGSTDSGACRSLVFPKFGMMCGCQYSKDMWMLWWLTPNNSATNVQGACCYRDLPPKPEKETRQSDRILGRSRQGMQRPAELQFDDGHHLGSQYDERQQVRD